MVGEFDLEKAKAVIHVICHECEPDLLGRTKLHKALYYADMLWFLQSGAPLTGEEYLKQPYGPTARHLAKALRALEAEGRVVVRRRAYFGRIKDDFISLTAPASNLLGPEEIALVREVTDWVCRHSAREISEISHAAPWASVGMGEPIPYHTAYWLYPPGDLSDEDRVRIQEEARQVFA